MRTPAGYLFLGEGVKYTKPPLTIDDQINLLTSRGMTIPDPARTSRYLSHISYFRLRGYWIPFEKEDNGKDHHFKAGTSWPERMRKLIQDSPGIRPSAMGFNENWTDLPVWNTNG